MKQQLNTPSKDTLSTGMSIGLAALLLIAIIVAYALSHYGIINTLYAECSIVFFGIASVVLALRQVKFPAAISFKRALPSRSTSPRVVTTTQAVRWRVVVSRRRFVFITAGLSLAGAAVIAFAVVFPDVFNANAATLSLQLVANKPRTESSWVHTVAWSPDGNEVASLWSDYILQIWDAHNGKELFQKEVGWGSGVAWSPDSKYIASISIDNTIQILDVAACQGNNNCAPVATYAEHNEQVNAIAWSPDGKYIASASDDHTVQVWTWNAQAGTTFNIFTYRDRTYQNGETPGKFTSISWSIDGKRIVSGDSNGHVRSWDAFTGADQLSYSQSEHNPITSVSWSPDGRYIASAGFRGIVFVWDAATGHTMLSIASGSNNVAGADGNTQNGPVYAVAWSPNGQYLVLVSYGTVQVRVALTGDQIGNPYHLPADPASASSSNGVFTAAWSPDGQRIVCGGGQGTILTFTLHG